MNKDPFIDYYGRGRDPVKIKEKTYIDNGINPLPLIDIIRERCIMCKEHEDDIRYCGNIKCPSWPYRMGESPFAETKEDWPKVITIQKAFIIEIRKDNTYKMREMSDWE